MGEALRRGIWTFVLVLLTAVIGASAIPQTDLPETSYNEVDMPVNQASPVVLGIRFVRPAKAVVILPRTTREADWNLDRPHEEMAVASRMANPSLHPRQDLLCILLI